MFPPPPRPWEDSGRGCDGETGHQLWPGLCGVWAQEGCLTLGRTCSAQAPVSSWLAEVLANILCYLCDLGCGCGFLKPSFLFHASSTESLVTLVKTRQGKAGLWKDSGHWGQLLKHLPSM